MIGDRYHVLEWERHGVGLHHWGQEDGDANLIYYGGVVAAHCKEGGGAHAVANVAYFLGPCY